MRTASPALVKKRRLARENSAKTTSAPIALEGLHKEPEVRMDREGIFIDKETVILKRTASRTVAKKRKRIAKENFAKTTSAPIALEGPHKEAEVRTNREGIFVDKETGNLNIRPDLDMSFRNDEFNDFGIRVAGFTQSPTDRQYLESLTFNKFMRLFHNQAMYLNHMAGYLGSSTDSIMKVNKELDDDLKKAWYAHDIALKRVEIFEGEIDALKKTAAETKKKAEEELKTTAAKSKKKAEEELKKAEDELAATVSVNKSMLAEIEYLKIQLEQANASSMKVNKELDDDRKKAWYAHDIALKRVKIFEGEIDALKKTVAETKKTEEELKTTAAKSKKKAEEELKKAEDELAATVSVNKSMLAKIICLKIQLEQAKASSLKVNKELDDDRKKAWYEHDIALKRVKIFEEEIDALKKTAAETKKKAEEELKTTAAKSKKKAEEELKKAEDELTATVSVNKSMLAEIEYLKTQLEQAKESSMKVNKELDDDRKKAWYARDIALKRVKIFEGEIGALKTAAAETKKKAEEELKTTAAKSKKKAEEELKKTEDELAATVSVNKSMLSEIEYLKIQLEQAKASSILELSMSEIPARYEPSDKFYQLLIDVGLQGFEMLQRALLRNPVLSPAAMRIVESMNFAALGEEETDMDE